VALSFRASLPNLMTACQDWKLISLSIKVVMVMAIAKLPNALGPRLLAVIVRLIRPIIAAAPFPFSRVNACLRVLLMSLVVDNIEVQMTMGKLPVIVE